MDQMAWIANHGNLISNLSFKPKSTENVLHAMHLITMLDPASILQRPTLFNIYSHLPPPAPPPNILPPLHAPPLTNSRAIRKPDPRRPSRRLGHRLMSSNRLSFRVIILAITITIVHPALTKRSETAPPLGGGFACVR